MREISLHSLPLGLRFRPTDEEVFNYYLMHKNSGHHEQVEFISEIDICKYEPWDLPGILIIKNCFKLIKLLRFSWFNWWVLVGFAALSTIKTIDLQWFFFCPQGWNRATNTGYWSETGRDQKIESGNKLIGMKKTLVYHFGRAPQGRRSSRWWMYEYRATSKHLDGTLPGQVWLNFFLFFEFVLFMFMFCFWVYLQSPFVLCRLFRKEDEIYYLMPKDLKMQTLIEVSTFNSFQFQIYSSRKGLFPWELGLYLNIFWHFI